MVPQLSRERYETFTPLDHKISVILNKMEKKDWALPPHRVGTTHL